MHASIPIAIVLIIAGKALSQITGPIIDPGPIGGHEHSPPAALTREVNNVDDSVIAQRAENLEARNEDLSARFHTRDFKKNPNEFSPAAGPFGPVRRDTPTAAGRGSGYQAVGNATPAGRGGGYQGSPTPSAA